MAQWSIQPLIFKLHHIHLGQGEGARDEIDSHHTVQANRVQFEGQGDEAGDIHIGGQGDEVGREGDNVEGDVGMTKGEGDSDEEEPIDEVPPLSSKLRSKSRKVKGFMSGMRNIVSKIMDTRQKNR